MFLELQFAEADVAINKRWKFSREYGKVKRSVVNILMVH